MTTPARNASCRAKRLRAAMLCQTVVVKVPEIAPMVASVLSRRTRTGVPLYRASVYRKATSCGRRRVTGIGGTA